MNLDIIFITAIVMIAIGLGMLLIPVFKKESGASKDRNEV